MHDKKISEKKKYQVMNGLEQQVVEVGIGKKEFQNMKAFEWCSSSALRYASFNKVVHLTCTELRILANFWPIKTFSLAVYISQFAKARGFFLMD